MKLRFVLVLCMMLAALPALSQEKQDKKELKTTKDKESYAIGLDMGKSLKQNEIEVEPDVLYRGIADGLSGAKPVMTEQEIKDTITGLQKNLQVKQEARLKAEAEKNTKAGEEFLAKNKKKKGVVTLPDGLQYKIIKEGTGKTPKATDTVTVNYRGTFVDGTEFDSSYKRGQPATFPVSGVIKGWTEALQLMKEGSKWELFIPPDLAYGSQARPGMPPNSTLIFEVELISVHSGGEGGMPEGHGHMPSGK